MKKAIFILPALAILSLSACNNAASKIKSEEDAGANSSTEVQSSPANGNQVNAQNMSSEGNPQFGFEEESFDFGTIEEGTIAKHDFTFTNTGDAPLIITNAAGSCGCTVPSWPREPIAPGETGEIHVEFNSTNRTGSQTKQVTLTSNTVPNKKVLRITAQVNPKPESGNS